MSDSKQDFTIFVVDDDGMSRRLLEMILEGKYQVELFESGEACLQRLADKKPNLFLLEVGLPGMNGYDLCRKIKEFPDISYVPMIFVTDHDEPEEVFLGYDAGGADYITKPFDVVGLDRKIENLRHIERDRLSLAEQARASDELATVVLASLDEYAILIKFLRALNECNGVDSIAETVLQVLSTLHLDGAVQIRLRNLEKTYNSSGANWPLARAVIQHARTLGRIFEFKTRVAYNFEHITILVTNLPVGDGELRGRLRDDLAIVAESVDAKLEALQSLQDKTQIRTEIGTLLDAISQTVSSYSQKYDEARYQGAEYTMLFLDDLLAMVAHLGMSDRQENEVLEMVKERTAGLIDLYDITGESQETLKILSSKLTSILAATQ
jgi:CheY-like chemotaxis protein